MSLVLVPEMTAVSVARGGALATSYYDASPITAVTVGVAILVGGAFALRICAGSQPAPLVVENGAAAFEQGKQAFKDGQTQAACPFPAGNQRGMWVLGWNHSERDAGAKGEQGSAAVAVRGWRVRVREILAKIDFQLERVIASFIAIFLAMCIVLWLGRFELAPALFGSAP